MREGERGVVGESGEPPPLSLEDGSIECGQGDPWSALDTHSGGMLPKMEQKASALRFCSENYVWGGVGTVRCRGV